LRLRFISAQDLADKFGVTLARVAHLLKKGRILGVKIGGRGRCWVIPVDGRGRPIATMPDSGDMPAWADKVRVLTTFHPGKGGIRGLENALQKIEETLDRMDSQT